MNKAMWRGLYASTLEDQVPWTRSKLPGGPWVYVAKVKGSTLTLNYVWQESQSILLSIQEEDGDVTNFRSELGMFWYKTQAQRLWEHVYGLFKARVRQEHCALTKKILVALQGVCRA